jgi:xanthine dehydrogenase molybdopterin-binding subunit B
MPDGVVNMSERMGDIARRYGRYPDSIRKANFELKEYFEKKLHRNLYEVISDKKKLWGR